MNFENICLWSTWIRVTGSVLVLLEFGVFSKQMGYYLFISELEDCVNSPFKFFRSESICGCALQWSSVSRTELWGGSKPRLNFCV